MDSGTADSPLGADAEDLLDQIGPALSRLRRRTSSARSDLTRNLVLNVIHERVGEITVGEVGVEMGIAQPVASRAVAACVADGLVRRAASQSDGRRTVVELTEAGEVERRHLATAQREGFELITAAWTPAERDQFARFLVRYSRDSADWAARHRHGRTSDPTTPTSG